MVFAIFIAIIRLKARRATVVGVIYELYIIS